jgi:UDP-N-acetylglucosamine 4,6-dehydratase/5-epimerase
MTLPLDSSRVLVFGGTGSLGRHMVRKLVAEKAKAVVVFSRGEKKQADMRREFADHPEVVFTLGDIRDRWRVREAMHAADLVINAAALKQVPACEEAPTEAVLTNVVGTINIRQEAIAAGVDTLLSISTDKAVKPVNVLGMTKAIHERIITSPPPLGVKTRFLCVRYGNVLGSRGSVVPLFCKCLAESKPLPITDEKMTRFILTLDEAIRFVFDVLTHGESGELWVKPCRSVGVIELGRAIARGLGKGVNYPTNYVGIRPGEKIHELLVSSEEVKKTIEEDGYFKIRPDYARLTKHPQFEEYSSFNAPRLSEQQILELLEKEGWLAGRLE